MMDFILVPLVVGIVTLGIYKLFELFVHKKERLLMIEKLSDKMPMDDVKCQMSFDLNAGRPKFALGALKAGLLMLGIGLGLIVGFFVRLNTSIIAENWGIGGEGSVVYGACVLLFGGLGLVAAFLIELKMNKKEN